MPKQKRYYEESQIITAMERLRELELADVKDIEHRKSEIKRLALSGDEQTIHHHKAMILEAEARINRRGLRIDRMKEKLAEFRTRILPGMADVVPDESIVR